MSEDCWICGGSTTPKYRKVLNSDPNKHLLQSLKNIGAANLPAALTQTPSASKRNYVYLCRACATETEKLCTLESYIKATTESLQSKFRSRERLEELTTELEVSGHERITGKINTIIKMHFKCPYYIYRKNQHQEDQVHVHMYKCQHRHLQDNQGHPSAVAPMCR